jgi:hypothetical protein
MDATLARSIAQRSLDGRRLADHIERVAAAVPSDARAIAFLHEAVGWTETTRAELCARGLTAVEAEALDLLTAAEGESYAAYVLRIAHARGPAGRLARAVKATELEDHMEYSARVPGRPPYAWGRRHIAIAQELRGERASEAVPFFASARRDRAAGLARAAPGA